MSVVEYSSEAVIFALINVRCFCHALLLSTACRRFSNCLDRTLLTTVLFFLLFFSVALVYCFLCAVIQAPAYNLFAWTTGGTWCWANGFCLWVLTSNAQDKKDLDVLDYIGVFFFVVGLSIETMADLQKYNFNKNHVSGSNAKWISGGLWGWSRHPNYVGEITLWFGLSLICLGGVSSISRQNKNIVRMGLVLVTPIWSMFFLIFTSLMLLEKSGDVKFGRKGERKKTGYKKAIRQWNLYKQKTPILFPTRLPTVGDLCCFQDGGGSGEYNMIDLTNDSSGLSSSLE